MLFKKYMSRPPSKRINFLDRAFLSPFSNQWSSVQKLHQLQSALETAEDSFFILKNRTIIRKLEQLFFSKNFQANLDNSFSQAEMNMINASYLGVRLTSSGKVVFFR